MTAYIRHKIWPKELRGPPNTDLAPFVPNVMRTRSELLWYLATEAYTRTGFLHVDVSSPEHGLWAVWWEQAGWW